MPQAPISGAGDSRVPNTTAVTPPRQARERREHLLDVALGLFSQRGAEQATIKDLAAAAGVAQGLIYHYFASKEDLLRALVEERSFLPRIREVLARPTERPAADALPEIARGIYEVFQEKRQLVRVIWHEALPILRSAKDCRGSSWRATTSSRGTPPRVWRPASCGRTIPIPRHARSCPPSSWRSCSIPRLSHCLSRS